LPPNTGHHKFDYYILTYCLIYGVYYTLALVQQLGFKQELYFFAVQPRCLKWQKPVSRLLDNNLPQMMQELLKHLQPLVSTA